MSTKLGWFGVRERDAATTIAALRALAAEQPKLALPEDGFRIATAHGNTSAVLLGWEYAAVHDWAAAASKSLSTVAVSFFLLEGSWDYGVYRDGQRLSAMTWYPAELPAMVGDAKRAGAALGVPVSLLRRYFDALLDQAEAELDDRDSIRAFPDDEFDLGNDWVHVDLARRLGFSYPEDGSVIVISRAS